MFLWDPLVGVLGVSDAALGAAVGAGRRTRGVPREAEGRPKAMVMVRCGLFANNILFKRNIYVLICILNA